MTVTVGWLARQTRLGLIVVAGSGHLDREIRWAHAIELADPGPYLSGAELVMTTGIAVGRTRQDQHDYVARLVAVNAAALAFDTGIRYHRVPAGIIAAGDALGLPILQVPASTPFIAITRAVIDRINADQLKSVQRTVDDQERLARATLRGGVPAVVAALAQALEATVVAISTAGRVLAGAGPDQDRVAALGADFAAGHSDSPASTRVAADGDGICSVQALRAAASTRGYLVVRASRPLNPAERLLISHSVSLISIELEKPSRILDAEQRLRVAVTEGLIAGPPITEPTLLRYFDFDPGDDVIVLAVNSSGPMLPERAQVQRVLHRTGLPFLMCPRDEDIVLVLPAAERDAITAVHRGLSRQIGREVVLGVSRVGGFPDLATLVSQASAASRAGGTASVRWFDEIGLFGAVLSGRSAAELAVLADAVAPLAGDDELMATLAAFLEHNGHLEGAAAELQVHRHTLRHRMARIGELLAVPLDSAQTRAVLLIALHARELRGGA